MCFCLELSVLRRRVCSFAILLFFPEIANLYILELIRANMMPILPIPLMVNMVISGAILMSEIAVILKVVLTLATVVKFSLFVYGTFFQSKRCVKGRQFLY